MTKQRTDAALKALAIKRDIPPGLTSIQITIQLPHDLIARVRSASPVLRGQIMESGFNMADLEDLEDLDHDNT